MQLDKEGTITKEETIDAKLIKKGDLIKVVPGAKNPSGRQGDTGTLVLRRVDHNWRVDASREEVRIDSYRRHDQPEWHAHR